MMTKLSLNFTTYWFGRILHIRDQVEAQVGEDRVDGVDDRRRAEARPCYTFEEISFGFYLSTAPSIFLVPALLAALAARWIEATGTMVAMLKPICTGL